MLIVPTFSCEQATDPVTLELEDVTNGLLNQIESLDFNSNEVKLYDDMLFIEESLNLVFQRVAISGYAGTLLWRHLGGIVGLGSWGLLDIPIT